MYVITDRETDMILSVAGKVVKSETEGMVYDADNDIYYPEDIAVCHEVGSVPEQAESGSWYYTEGNGFSCYPGEGREA